ncbi:MAG TPA: TRAP transporter substrate-binding protein [Beijerinckiaceae bacterium]|jgi:tripartite ATP-independent transporter DctP family solute receptor
MSAPTRRGLLLGGLSLAAMGPSPGSAATRVLRAVDTQHADYPTVQGLLFIARRVSRATDNALRIRVFPGGQLGEEQDSIEQVRRGVIDVTRINASLLSETQPRLRALQAPYLIRSDAHLQRVIDGPIGAGLLRTIDGAEHRALTFYDSGARSIYNRVRPINRPADLKGLRIRVQQSSPAVDLLRAFGATPIPLPFSQVLPALSAGLIDGAENNWPSYVTARHHEAAGHMSETEHVRTPEILLISSRTWDALGAEERRIVQEAADLSRAFVRRIWSRWTALTRAQAIEAGVDVARHLDRDSFVEASRPAAEALAADDAVAQVMAEIRGAA